MDQDENYLLAINKHLEERLDLCLHSIEWRLDQLYQQDFHPQPPAKESSSSSATSLAKSSNQFSSQSLVHFRAPYIRDFRNFSSPLNEDAKHIKQLAGSDNINLLIQSKSWTKESRKQLQEAVLEHYSQRHLLELIKQKNSIFQQLANCSETDELDLKQKLHLIEEQSEQVKARKEVRVFVPELGDDSSVDWFAISAKLTGTNHDASDCRLMWSNSLHWQINNNSWTKEEDLCLLNAVQKYGKHDWDSVARELNSHRLAWQCCARFNEEFLSSSAGSSRSKLDEIVQVINLCRIGDFVPWNQVMYFIQSHSLLQVKYIWQKMLADRRSNLPWSQAEDLLLIKSVERFGDKDWNRISSYLAGRTNKSCRERYIHRLNYTVRAIGKWTKKEDQRLILMVDRFGLNWSLISTMFPERNSHQIRSRYELLNCNVPRAAPNKRKRLKKNLQGLLVMEGRARKKAESEAEVDKKLTQIFATYQNFKIAEKSLICRSAQDEILHANLTRVLRNILTGRQQEHNLLSYIIEMAVKERVSFKYELFPPSTASLLGFKTWKSFTEHRNEQPEETLRDSLTSSSCYQHTLKIIMTLFLWPALLSKLEKPENMDLTQASHSIVERNTKNLYKIRELQKQIIAKGTAI